MANPLAAFMIRPFMQWRQAKKLDISAPNGIREEQFVHIGGIDQWVTIRGQNRQNPVLLFVHGGPGSPYTGFNPWLTEWEKHFTLVQWDQPGGGKTFGKNGVEGTGVLTLDRLANDGLELVEYVCKHLNQPKIVLLGSSLGSLVAMKMIHARPQRFYAYVGAEQNSPNSRPLTYKLTKEAVKKARDTKGLDALARMGADDSKWTLPQVDTLNKLAIKVSRDVPDMVYDIMLPALLFAPDYTMKDIQVIQKGMEFSMEQLFSQIMSFDLRTLGYDFNVPLFIFQGEGDILTPVATAKKYFDQLRAPHKEFVLIPHAGHLAEFANHKQFLRELLARVLPYVK